MAVDEQSACHSALRAHHIGGHNVCGESRRRSHLVAGYEYIGTHGNSRPKNSEI